MAKQADLVDDIITLPDSRHTTWFDGLTDTQKSVALSVRKKMPRQHGVYQPIAKRLIEKLGLSVTPGTVAIWLKEHE